MGTYFVFVMLMVYGASLATGINQNGVFAYVSGFGREEYTQAIMAGQGVAGVLPCVVQILSVVVVAEPDDTGEKEEYNSSRTDMRAESPKSAFVYFFTATAVSALALVCFLHLWRRHPSQTTITEENVNEGPAEEMQPEPEEQLDFVENNQNGAPPGHGRVFDDLTGVGNSSSNSGSGGNNGNTVPLSTLFWKLHWLAISVALCFAVTMVFPVFTAEIHSVHQVPPNARIPFSPPIFIPVAFLLWNLGDLLGRLAIAVPSLSGIVHAHPVRIFLLAVARLVFIPLYRLCNIHDRGATIESDFYYLFIVQLFFGFSNGYVGSCCMMAAAYWVDEGEKEAAGGFMSLMLVMGLTIGSLASFLVG